MNIALPGKGQGFSWMVWEIIRITIIAGVVFGFVQWRAVDRIGATQHLACRNSTQIRENQRVVLRTLVTIVLALNDRTQAGLRPIPSGVFEQLEQSLSNLPNVDC